MSTPLDSEAAWDRFHAVKRDDPAHAHRFEVVVEWLRKLTDITPPDSMVSVYAERRVATRLRCVHCAAEVERDAR